jgi:glycerol-3-phosphate dehydrogenase (NAD(P)+)
VSAPISIVGAGSFGRGLAAAAARNGRDVLLYSRRGVTVDVPRVQTTDSLAELARAELVLVAVPSQYVREVAHEIGGHLDGSHLMAHVSRGLVGDDLETLSHVLRTETPVRRVGVIAGPLSAEALLEGTPTGGIVGSRFPEVAHVVREAIAGPAVRLYATNDLVGVEVASAMVGLLSLVTGFAQGIGLGPATLAIMGTRGLAEAARIGVALGADERTFHGLAGVGDLLSAAGGDERPELRLGRALAKGATLESAGREVGAYIEGVSIAERVSKFAAHAGVQAPITDAVAHMLSGELTPRDAIERLMTRRVGHE